MKKSLAKGIWNANEKARKMKKIFCFDICSCHYLRQNLSTSDLSFSQVTSVEKREPRKHFSASAYGLGFKNFFLGTLFSTSVTWEKLKSDVDKFCLRRGKNKYRNKILFLLWTPSGTVQTMFYALFQSFDSTVHVLNCVLVSLWYTPSKSLFQPAHLSVHLVSVCHNFFST